MLAVFLICSISVLNNAAAKEIYLTRNETLFQLSVIHFNDFHARFDETNPAGGTCKTGEICIGGFSRLYSQIMRILENNVNNSVLLNAGDNFQGTFWYTVGKWNITQEFMNKLPIHATVLGNHEFDDQIPGVIPFIQALNHPVVVSNINDDLEPEFHGTYSKSTVIERNGKKIGIIGVIDSKTNERASTGKLIFYPESPSVNLEAERLVREEGVFTNIVLSHSGYEKDKLIAVNATDSISLIVGADSHTFLYSGDTVPGPELPEGPYPTVVKTTNGKDVLIVQASAYCRFLGNITIDYDSNGIIQSYSGKPIYLDSTKPQDSQINKELEPWRELVKAQGEKVIGSTQIELDRTSCKYSECTLGNLVTDAMVLAYMDLTNEWWTYSSIALYNSGGLRSTIDIGNITYGNMMISVPFENTIHVGEIQGKYIKEALEQTALITSDETIENLKLFQTSGIQYIIDMAKPLGHRIVSLQVRCQKCQIPTYTNIVLEEFYRIIFPSYFLNSADAVCQVISKNINNVHDGELDIDVIIKYLQYKSPVFQEEEGRVKLLWPS